MPDVNQSPRDNIERPATEEIESSLGDFRIPDGANIPPDRRRTWEGYASDFRSLTMQLSMLQGQHDALSKENADLRARYDDVQAQRREDQRRLTLIGRAHSAIEATSAKQATRMRSAQNALADRQTKIAQLEESYHQATEENGRLRAEIQMLAETKAVTSPSSVSLSAIRACSSRPKTSILDRVIASLSLRRARAAAREGCWAQAETLYQVVLLTRDEPRLWGQLGNILCEQKHYEAASIAYREAINRDPENGETHALLSVAEASQGNMQGAREAYRQALEIDPSLQNNFSELHALLQRDVA